MNLNYELNKINCRFVEYKAGQGADNRECGEVRTPFFRPRPWRERGPQRGPMPLRLPPPTGGGTGEGRAKRKRPPSTMAYVQPCGWRWRAGRPCITHGSTDVPGCQDPGPTAPPLAVRRSGRGRRSRAAPGRLAGPLTAAARSDTPTEGTAPTGAGGPPTGRSDPHSDPKGAEGARARASAAQGAAGAQAGSKPGAEAGPPGKARSGPTGAQGGQGRAYR